MKDNSNSLPGAGKPLHLDDYLNEDPDTRVAHRMLRANGFTLPWIEEMNDLDRSIKAARSSLKRSWERRAKMLDAQQPEEIIEKSWQQEVAAFRQRVTQINRDVLSFNFKAPLIRFQRSPLNVERELAALRDGGDG